MSNKKLITFIPPHKGEVTGRKIRSLYSKDGSYVKDFPHVQTVADLIEVLRQLPGELPLNNLHWDEVSGGYRPVWFNVGEDSEHLQFEELDSGEAEVEDWDDDDWNYDGDVDDDDQDDE